MSLFLSVLGVAALAAATFITPPSWSTCVARRQANDDAKRCGEDTQFDTTKSDTICDAITFVLQHTVSIRRGGSDTTGDADTADKGGTIII